MNIPERASEVKDLLAIFLGSPGGLFAYAPRQSPEGPFLGGSDWVEESVLGFDCHGLVLRGCSRRSFHCGGTPIHPFVNPPACCGSRPGRLGPDTEYSIATVSRTQAVLIGLTLDNRVESTGLVRLALRPRGPLLQQEGGRCNRLSDRFNFSCCSTGTPCNPRRACRFSFRTQGGTEKRNHTPR